MAQDRRNIWCLNLEGEAIHLRIGQWFYHSSALPCNGGNISRTGENFSRTWIWISSEFWQNLWKSWCSLRWFVPAHGFKELQSLCCVKAMCWSWYYEPGQNPLEGRARLCDYETPTGIPTCQSLVGWWSGLALLLYLIDRLSSPVTWWNSYYASQQGISSSGMTGNLHIV